MLAATFHLVCARLLREHGSLFGQTERYTIYDQGDMRHVVESLLSDTNRSDIQRTLADYGQPAEMLAEVSRAKNLLHTRQLRAVRGGSGRAADRQDVDKTPSLARTHAEASARCSDGRARRVRSASAR